VNIKDSSGKTALQVLTVHSSKQTISSMISGKLSLPCCVACCHVRQLVEYMTMVVQCRVYYEWCSEENIQPGTSALFPHARSSRSLQSHAFPFQGTQQTTCQVSAPSMSCVKISLLYKVHVTESNIGILQMSPVELVLCFLSVTCSTPYLYR
jgi:hypothetical protein